MGQPGRPADLDETVLDEKRERRFPPRDHAGLTETLVDPGRRRLADGAEPQEWPDEGLPEFLATRYELIRRLEPQGSQGELCLVRVRADGADAVLKRRHTARPLDPDLVAYLGMPDAHIVRHLEAGMGYEVMVYVPGRTLREQLATARGGFGFAELNAVVEQISAGLIYLHRAGFVHRDVKPGNIVVGSTNPVHATLVDFGIAGPLGATQWPDEPNLAYQPPEWSNLRRVGTATDWWGLGMTVLELASGEHPFEGLANEDIRGHFGTARPIDVSGVPADPPTEEAQRLDRLRNLCQGLLALDPAERWGEEQVGRWLAGSDPDLPDVVAPRSAPAESTDLAAEQPYPFAGTPYHYRDNLATAMATKWNYAVQVLFEHDGLSSLREWLEQFPDGDGAEARGVVDAVASNSREPDHVRLLRVLQALHPTRLPVYRNHNISRRHLMVIAHDALEDESDNVSVLVDLWNHRLLPGFDSAAPEDPEAGGEDLTEIDRRWRCAYRDWPALIDQVRDPAAHAYLRDAVSEPEVLAVCLREALRRPEDLSALPLELRQKAAALPVRMPWFDQLVKDPAMTWVALLAHAHASSQARLEDDRMASVVRKQDAMRAEVAFTEWSRRQNRPAALGWAVTGVCLMAALWCALITISDLTQWAGDAVITLAWVGAALCLAVSLVAECLLAAEIGGRFHSRHSIPGAGLMALRPVARWMRRSPLAAMPTILAAATGVGLVTLEFPQVLAAATTIVHLGWTVRRLRAWHAQTVVENAQIAESELRRPSDTDAVPIGAAGGVGS